MATSRPLPNPHINGSFHLQSLDENADSPLLQRRRTIKHQQGQEVIQPRQLDFDMEGDYSVIPEPEPPEVPPKVPPKLMNLGNQNGVASYNRNGVATHNGNGVATYNGNGLQQEDEDPIAALIAAEGDYSVISSPGSNGADRTGLMLPQLTNMSLGSAQCSRCGHGFSRDEEIVNSNGEMWHTHCFVGELTLKRTKARCAKCRGKMEATEEIVNYNGQLWHPRCFTCAQCFRPFPEGIFYEFDGRKYCEYDFKMLFAPFCAKSDCNNFIVGRVIKAMNANWHPECFNCEICSVCLADSGYFKNANRALCKECNDRENAAGKGKYICNKCKSVVEEGLIKYKGEPYHAYHFNCKNCNIELTSDAREVRGELYCLRCHDKMGIPICGACRRPIDGERIVHALGKAWHVEHFVCAQCEKPFLGTRHYEKKGLAYCETHYHQLFGNICFTCNQIIAGDVFSALNKSWCVNCFACSICDKKMSQKTKFYEFDLKPVCKHCYEKFPSELKKRLKKAYENSPKK